MNFYSKKQNIKLLLFFIASVIGIAAIWYSGYLVNKLSEEEKKKVILWAETMKELEEMPIDGYISPILSKIIEDNKTIPAILVDENDNIIAKINLHQEKKDLKKVLSEMKHSKEPIVINFSEGKKNYVYYQESVLLTKLFYYPYIQISVIAVFMVISYLAFSNSRRAEENQVWVGMSKETAHQLGTPISSLLAWVELLKMKENDSKLIQEVEKDIKRLETITERFSKIGSKPDLVSNNISQIVSNSLDYLKTRTSKKIEFIFEDLQNTNLEIKLNVALFEWVIENICKNAIDAMSGVGTIITTISEKENYVVIDISDTGKGISKNKFSTVFKPGFTTKKRGWGLGLSLAKRIIEIYHSGKIFVKQSEPYKKTTFRILLRK